MPEEVPEFQTSTADSDSGSDETAPGRLTILFVISSRSLAHVPIVIVIVCMEQVSRGGEVAGTSLDYRKSRDAKARS